LLANKQRQPSPLTSTPREQRHTHTLCLSHRPENYAWVPCRTGTKGSGSEHRLRPSGRSSLLIPSLSAKIYRARGTGGRETIEPSGAPAKPLCRSRSGTKIQTTKDKSKPWSLVRDAQLGWAAHKRGPLGLTVCRGCRASGRFCPAIRRAVAGTDLSPSGCRGLRALRTAQASGAPAGTPESVQREAGPANTGSRRWALGRLEKERRGLLPHRNRSGIQHTNEQGQAHNLHTPSIGAAAGAALTLEYIWKDGKTMPVLAS
jgi:hypothetical protein